MLALQLHLFLALSVLCDTGRALALGRGDCTFASLSDTARVTLPMGQTISKEEYRLACTNSLGDATVGETTIATNQVVTVDKSSFGVEFTLTTKAFAPKGEVQQSVSYPAAFFLAVDLRTNQVTEVRMYAQNIALLAARGYSMVPDSSYGPVIRPA